MPTSYQVKLPPPADWQELQRMTCDLYRRIWDDDDVQEFGSLGQRQHGVDVFGIVGHSKGIAGIQCKRVTTLRAKDVEEEYKKSLKFAPALSQYIIVTTSKRNTAVQRKSVELTQQGRHRCTIVFWEDFCQRIAEHKDILRKYYSDFILYKIIGDSPGKLIKIDIDVNHYEILVSRLPGSDAYYRGAILIADLQSGKCTTYRLGGHWSRLDGVVGITTCDAFLVSTWLNSFANVKKLLRLGRTTLTYELTARERANAKKNGFSLLTGR